MKMRDSEWIAAPGALSKKHQNPRRNVSPYTCAIIAEIGVDMSCFKTAEHICSWFGLYPGNNERAGKCF